MLRIEHEGEVALALLDRPEKRNALTPETLGHIEGLRERMVEDAALGRRAGALVLAGEGAAFCAGFDLGLCRDDPTMMGVLLTRLSHAVRSLRRLPIPVVCAAHGAALAGGCALLCACDVVVTEEGAKLGYPVVRLGVSPAVNEPLVRQSMAGGRLRERLLDPEPISGREAARIGLAHECVANPHQARARAMEIARGLSAKPRHGLAATKRWLNELEGSDRDEMFDRALAASMALAGGDEEQERLAALWRR